MTRKFLLVTSPEGSKAAIAIDRIASVIQQNDQTRIIDIHGDTHTVAESFTRIAVDLGIVAAPAENATALELLQTIVNDARHLPMEVKPDTCLVPVTLIHRARHFLASLDMPYQGTTRQT